MKPHGRAHAIAKAGPATHIETFQGTLRPSPSSHHHQSPHGCHASEWRDLPSWSAAFDAEEEIAALLERPADPTSLHAVPDEAVPPSLIPDVYHVKVRHEQRPEALDAKAPLRFDWAPDESGGGVMTVFPMARPRGALDSELLELTVRRMVAISPSNDQSLLSVLVPVCACYLPFVAVAASMLCWCTI